MKGHGEARADSIVERGRRLVGLFKEVGVPSDKYLLRIPATWQGIQAAKVLEGEGVATHLILIYRYPLHRPTERHTSHARAHLSKRHSHGCALCCSRCVWWPQQGPAGRGPCASGSCSQIGGRAGLRVTAICPPAPGSFVQAAAAAQAGVSVISPNIGRIGDFYQRNPGAIRNPRVGAPSQPAPYPIPALLPAAPPSQ